MAACGLSAVLVTGSVHVRPNGGSCLCKAAKLFCTPLCTCKVTGSKVCTNHGDVEVEEDGLTAAECDLVGPVPVRRRTNPIGSGTRGRRFPEAEGRVL